MHSKIKLVYFGIVISVITDAVPNSKSFKKCLEYNGGNGTIDDLIPARFAKQIPFIVVGGGDDAELGQFPFMAALGYGNASQIKYFCGGTLISDQFVLTAAHCKFSSQWGPVRFVRLGALNLQRKTSNEGVQMFLVQDYHSHSNYTYPIKYHDIALIKLDKPAVFSSTVLPACLDFSRDQIPQRDLHVTGWGATGNGEEQSDRLQYGRIIKFNISECQKTFPKEQTLPSGIDDKSQLCAGAGMRLTDTCEGDSGGPLGHVYFLQDKVIHFVIGVTSFGKTCLQEGIPAVYTRVSYYTDWIESIVWPEKNRVLSEKIIFPAN